MALRVAVIGGGIAGLTAAFRLRQLAAAHEFPLEVTLLEASARLGGALNTIQRDGFILEGGADSFLIDRTDVLELTGNLGIEDELIQTEESNRGALVVHDGRLIPVPDGFSLMAPSRIGPVLRSPLFTPSGKLRMMFERFVRPDRDGADESLESFATRRLGREAFERLVQPLAGGIYTADPASLSMMAAFPRFLMMERQYGSLSRGLRAARESQGASLGGVRYNMFLSFRGGIGALVHALEQRLGGSIRTHSEVIVASRAGGSWRLGLMGGGTFPADGLICAAPAWAASRIFEQSMPALAQRLAAIDYASSAIVNFAFDVSRRPDFPPGFGVIVPACERRRIIALSFSSRKFSGRAPEEMLLLRAFMGGAMNPELVRLSDDELTATALEEIRDLSHSHAEPLFTVVSRWPDSMPQYNVGHRDRVAGIEREVAAIPTLRLAGAAYRGVGIPDCVRGGVNAADTLFSELAGRD